MLTMASLFDRVSNTYIGQVLSGVIVEEGE